PILPAPMMPIFTGSAAPAIVGAPASESADKASPACRALARRFRRVPRFMGVARFDDGPRVSACAAGLSTALGLTAPGVDADYLSPMAVVVFLRGVNVGGHRRLRPSVLAKELERLDVVSIGAAGTFVVRKP